MKKENEIMKEVYKAPFIEMVVVRVERGFDVTEDRSPEAPGATDPNKFTW